MKKLFYLILAGLGFESSAINITIINQKVYVNGKLVGEAKSVVNENGRILLDGKELNLDQTEKTAEEENKKVTTNVLDWSKVPDMTDDQMRVIKHFYKISQRVSKYYKRVEMGKPVDWKHHETKSGEFPSAKKFRKYNKGHLITIFNEERNYIKEYNKLLNECGTNIKQSNIKACAEIVNILFSNGVREHTAMTSVVKKINQFFDDFSHIN